MRPSWDDYFGEIASVVAKRSPDLKRRVGCVIVSPDHRILATGYNGLPAGYTCDMDWWDKGQKDRLVIHAEQNAIIHCDYTKMRGATIYVTLSPCVHCAKMIANSGIARVVCAEEQADSGLDVLRECGVEVSVAQRA